MKEVDLFFGSFNPVHIGHLIIANYCVEFTELEEVWFVPSPQNPLKKREDLASPEVRLQMLKIALEDRHPKIKLCLDELQLPTPSYTHQTIEHLQQKYPELNFTLILGDDSLRSLHRWKNYTNIVQQVKLMVYPRRNNITDPQYPFNIPYNQVNAPLIDISSTQIRTWLANHYDVRMFLPKEVYEYIIQNNLYQ